MPPTKSNFPFTGGILRSLEQHFRVFHADLGVVRNRFGDKAAASDDDAVSDHGFTAEHGGIRVDRHVIPDRRMALDAGKLLPAPCGKRAQRDALIQFDIVANDRRFPDDNTCSVVNEKIFSDDRAGVDIDPRLAMCVFRHDPRDERNTFKIQDMGDPIYKNRKQAGIGYDDFRFAFGCGVPVVSRIHVA